MVVRERMERRTIHKGPPYDIFCDGHFELYIRTPARTGIRVNVVCGWEAIAHCLRCKFR
jgi:hypothetical protein